MLEHDYALLGGLNRARVGRYLSIVAASVSAGIVFVLLAAVNLVQRLGLPANLTPSVLSALLDFQPLRMAMARPECSSKGSELVRRVEVCRQNIPA